MEKERWKVSSALVVLAQGDWSVYSNWWESLRELIAPQAAEG